MKSLSIMLDEEDFQAVQHAIGLRMSSMFRINGVLLLPNGNSEPRGSLLAEICRSWANRVALDETDKALSSRRKIDKPFDTILWENQT